MKKYLAISVIAGLIAASSFIAIHPADTWSYYPCGENADCSAQYKKQYYALQIVFYSAILTAICSGYLAYKKSKS